MRTEFIGTIHSGLGTAKEYVAKQYYFAYFTKFLGHKPFLGTLNIHLEQEDLADYHDAVKMLETLAIPELHLDSDEYWGITCYFVSIRRLASKGRGERCLALNFDRPEHPEGIIEIVAGSNLRVKLKLEDGMQVIISLSS